ncbi:hypothetical protein JCM10908_000203 [Rhodotorula pacifica]|uniref:transcriptional coactivator p15/PC4 family protein n=1 Tax=Rhodotorula pacifica TaxID=1495444 RepID=UPI00316AF440
MPKKLSEEYVDSDDDNSSPPAKESRSKSKRVAKRQVSESEEEEASASESGADSSEEKPLKKKSKKEAIASSKDKAKSKEKEKEPIKKPAGKKDRSESPQTKRKVGAAAKYGSGAEIQTNAEGDKFIELAKNRRATVRVFKGKTYVDIRETYEQGGETKPGKKGIMLNIEQWDRLKKAISTIDEAVDDLA